MKQIKHMILLCLFCLTGIAAQAQEEGPASNEIWYTATSQVTPTNILGTNGAVLTVTGNDYDESAGCWKITFTGAVITIGESAFNGCKVLSSITIPASVTSIGNSAFQSCSALESINIPASVTSIGTSVFQSCSALESISVDANNSVYSSPNNCNAIIETATHKLIQGCKSTVIPESVEIIKDSAFWMISTLKSITIPANVKSIGNYAFYMCCDRSNKTGLTTVTFAEGSQLETIGEKAFYYCMLSSITIPASVTSIEKSAFYQCSSLTTVTFAEGSQLGTIRESVFSGCKVLSSITIPASVTSIGKNAFQNCYDSNNKTGLTEVTFAEGSQLGTIGEKAFYGCSALSSITIPASVTSIGKGAFQSCYDSNNKTGLTKVTFAEGSKLVTIGESAFNGCKFLSSITIPASVTSIGKNAFQYCALESINIPASVTSFGQSPFNGCTGLEAISVDAGNPVFSSPDGCNAIIDTAKNTLIQGCKNTVIPESVKIIGTNAFQNMATLESIDIPASVTSISGYAFQFCDILKSVTIPASSVLESLGSNAFGSCEALESINIPASVTRLEDYTFNFCSNLKSVTVNWTAAEKIVTITSKVFKDVSKDMTLIVPVGTESLYAAATGWSSYAAKMKVYITANQDPNNKKDYYATFYSKSKAYKLSTEDVTAYTGAVDGSVLKLKPIADGIIPAGEGVVLKLTSTDDTEAKVNFLVEGSTEAGTKDTVNVLTGTDEATTLGANQYALSLGQNGVGFYKWEGKSIGAHKAYLTLSSGAKAFTFEFDDGTTTGITSYDNDNDNDNENLYNLNGIRVNDSYKGIVIKNGKKYVVK